ncbi:amidohydrolase family protein [Xanthobacter aminoxidans]|uniref:Amidohydrolase family protein n=1 Tax=Xanthobacter aminoxidans TaxID=186280 RepID=A0ABW6ZP30_9HYPH
MIVDSQIHVWAAETPDRPWPAERMSHPQRSAPFLPSDALCEMDAAGVAGAVLVPPTWEGDRNDLALAAARAHPGRFTVMGRLALDAPDARDLVAGWRDHLGLSGFRLTFHTPALRRHLDDPSASWLWRSLEDSGAPVMISVPGMARALQPVAERYEGLRIAVCHLARPIGGQEEAGFADLDDMLALSRFAHVSVKASATPCNTRDAYPFPRVHRHLLRVRDHFGAERMFWGSDLTRLPCTYRQCIDLFAEALPGLSEPERAQILGRSLCRWLNWTPTSPGSGARSP